MKTLKFLLIATVAFVFSFGANPALAQGEVTLPEPIFPLRETGRYAERLIQLKHYLRADIDEFVKLSKKLEDEIFAKRQKYDIDGAEYSKEDFAASEWLTFFICSAPFPKVSDTWTKDCNPHFTLFYVAIGKYLGRYRSEVETLQLKNEEKKIVKNRAIYMPALSRKIRNSQHELEEEVLGINVRGVEYRMKVMDEILRVRIKNGFRSNDVETTSVRKIGFATF